MERELWPELSRAVDAVAAAWRESSKRYTHPTAQIVRVHLWSVLHDRPTCWACDPANWPAWARPARAGADAGAGAGATPTLPDQSTMSRRKRTKPFERFMDAVGARLSGRPSASSLLKRLDGKALPVAAHSKDRDAAWGRGAGQQSNGYKLHAVWSDRPMPEQWAVTPLDVCEKRVARRLLKRLGGSGGYVLADAYYDASDLHDRAAHVNHQLVAPRRMPGTGLGHCYQSPHRLRSIAITEPPAGVNPFGPSLRTERDQVERDFGNVSSFGGGLTCLPAWARRVWRVRPWVHGKLLVNAARIRRLRRRRKAVDA